MTTDPNLRVAEVEWHGDLRFQGGSPGASSVLLDAGGDAGPGPMVTLLVAAAACSGADVVSILEKMQVKLRRYRMVVSGTRAPEHPKRYVKLHFMMQLAGDGLDEPKARRAIDLSLEKYCSVLLSLNPDIPVTYELLLDP
jgi:putative redox protein